MSDADYRREDLVDALARLPLNDGDVVFCHSNLGFFGRPDCARGDSAVCNLFISAIAERLGPGGTMVVPTFTFSFPRHEVFDVQQSASAMGMFAEAVRRHPGAMRTADPCYSVAALGARAAELTANMPENSFGDESFFARFFKADGKVLNFNFDAGSTFLHYVERVLRVPYRFDKSFHGILRDKGVERKATSTIWVRYVSDDSLEAAFEAFDTVARSEGCFTTLRLGRGELGVITARDCFELVAHTIERRPWFLTRAEPLGITSPRIVAEE
jgi:aminoglycoside 3-N-acetyltransferase